MLYIRYFVSSWVVCAASVAALGAQDVVMSIDSTAAMRPISPYVYGVNFNLLSGATLDRLGGNRYTAYNWENNASNAGSDFFHQNDGFLSNSNVPGEAVRPFIQSDGQAGRATLVTVPINGYVSADKNGGGDVANTPNYLQTRFKQLLPRKNAPFTTSPSTADDFVYADEFVNWVESVGRVSPDQTIFYGLDNEPELWSSTHNRIHPEPVRYEEIRQKTIDYASAIKDVRPDAKIFGPVNYGWYAYRTLQDAPDAAGRDFHRYFLAEMAAAEQSAGRRLVDVLDVHWYPEAQGGGVRITDGLTDPASIAARVQAPRSLWDPSYTEQSWITQFSTGGPIRLLERLQDNVDTFYPGTQLAITEYNYGASNHISGAIAQADVLGILGREGVFAATWWDLTSGPDRYVQGALDMFRNFDGAGATFGDTSVQASTSDVAASSVYASIDSAGGTRLVVVAINRTTQPLDAAIHVAHTGALDVAQVYLLTATGPLPVRQADVALSGSGQLEYTLPPLSVSTLVFSAAPRITDLNGDGAVDAADAGILFSHWGSAQPLADVTGDGIVDAADAGQLFSDWTGDTHTTTPEPHFIGCVVWVVWLLRRSLLDGPPS